MGVPERLDSGGAGAAEAAGAAGAAGGVSEAAGGIVASRAASALRDLAPNRGSKNTKKTPNSDFFPRPLIFDFLLHFYATIFEKFLILT